MLIRKTVITYRYRFDRYLNYPFLEAEEHLYPAFPTTLHRVLLDQKILVLAPLVVLVPLLMLILVLLLTLALGGSYS